MFKNLVMYRLQNPETLNRDALEEALSRKAFRDCGSQDLMSRGWAPLVKNGEYVIAASGHWLLRLQIQERLLSSSAVKQEAERRAEAISEKQGFKMGRKQMKELREMIVQELLPNALRKDTFVSVWIDPRGGWLGIDTSSVSKADQVIEVLRHTVESLQIKLVRTEMTPVSSMTSWLADEAPEKFTVDRECELRLPTEERSVVKYVRHALDGDDIREHLSKGKTPVSLAMTWSDRLSFVLTEKFGLKKLALLDAALADSGADDEQDEMAILIASLFLFGETMAKMLADLIPAMGGEMRAAAS